LGKNLLQGKIPYNKKEGNAKEIGREKKEWKVESSWVNKCNLRTIRGLLYYDTPDS
jgi:hypothetical protein